VPELATIGNAVQLRALPSNLHFGEVDIRTDASEIGVDQRERDCGPSRAASEIEHTAHVGLKVTPDPRQQVIEMVIDDAQVVAIEDGRRQLFKAPRRGRANELDETPRSPAPNLRWRGLVPGRVRATLQRRPRTQAVVKDRCRPGSGFQPTC
jgi:hypothetical protein